jgi:outer membrane receptor protein involved in Fe transport
VEIVKGAAATTLYGTEASGGVIQIFTKRGVAGAPAWEAGMGFGYNDIGHIGPDSDETGFFVKQCRGAGLVNSAGQPFVDPTCPESGTWVQKGLVQRYSLSVRGGAQNLTYSLSGNYDDQEGAIQTGGAKVGSFRGNFTFAPRSDLNFQLSTGYTRRSIRWVGDGNNASGFLLNVSRGANSNYKNPVYCSGVATGTTCVANEEIFNESNYTRGDHFITGLVANWNPTARLTNRFSVGFDYSYSDDQSARPFGNYRSPAGIINKIDWLHTKLSIDYAGSYQAPLGESWTSTTSWGGQMFRDKDNFTRVDAQNFAGPGDPTIGGAANSSVLESDRIQVVNGGFFGQQMFGLRDRLFLTAGLRVDGNSAFGEDFGMQAYPKLGASWVAVDSRDGALQTARLRLAAGESGKAPGAFDAVKTWNPIAGDEGKPAVTPSQLGNPNLGPERTREIEGGFDLAALDGRLGVEATYFYARTFDALVPVDYPPSQGFIATQLENVGTLESKGLELSIEGNPIRSESFDWRLRGILTAVQTKAVDLNGEVIQFGDSRAEVREGYPVPSFFGRKITNPNDFAEPIVAEDQFLGSNYPDRVMSLQTTFVLFRRLTIDALGEWQTGAYVYNGIGYQNALRFVFQPCYEAQAKLNAFAGGDATALDDVTARDRGRCAIDRTKQNDRYWIDATDFFKLRTVSVTYDVPMAVAQKLRLRSASVTAAGRNLFTSTDYQGTDPEVADGRDAASDSGSGPLSSNTSRVGRRDYYNLPPLRSFVFTLRLGF